MMFEVRNLFKKEIADQVCETLGLKPNALIEPMVGKGNFGTEDRLEHRTNKVRILHAYYSDHAERVRMEEMQKKQLRPRAKEEEVSIDVSRKALRSYYGNAGQKRFFGRKT